MEQKRQAERARDMTWDSRGRRARRHALARAWRTAIVALPPRTSIEATICSAEQRGRGAVVFFAGTLNASADRRCPAPVSDAVPDDPLPRSAYTAPASTSARTPPRTTQVSRVRITFDVRAARVGRSSPPPPFREAFPLKLQSGGAAARHRPALSRGGPVPRLGFSSLLPRRLNV